jgi:large subunit ribosomal protein L22
VIQMGDFQYSFQNFDRSKHVRAALREKSISHKHAREVAIALKGMSIERARVFLEDVIAKKIAVPYRRYNNEVAHRSNIRDGYCSGRFPQKTAKEVLKLLDNLESNAEYKGMDLDSLKIISAVVHKGTRIERFTPRAMGRASPKFNTLVHFELVAMEGRIQ